MIRSIKTIGNLFIFTMYVLFCVFVVVVGCHVYKKLLCTSHIFKLHSDLFYCL